MFCPECGTQIKEGSKFCVKCGHRIEAEIKKETTPVNTSPAKDVKIETPSQDTQKPESQLLNKNVENKKVDDYFRKRNKNDYLKIVLGVIMLCVLLVIVFSFTRNDIETVKNSKQDVPVVNWVEYRTDEYGVYLYKKGNIDKDGIVQTLIKQVYSDKGKKFEIQARIKKGHSIEGWDKLSDLILMIENDCKKSMYRYLSYTYSDTDGKVLDILTDYDPKWMNITPGSMGDNCDSQTSPVQTVDSKPSPPQQPPPPSVPAPSPSPSYPNVRSAIDVLFEGESFTEGGKYSHDQRKELFNRNYKDQIYTVNGKIITVGKAAFTDRKYITIEVKEGHRFDVYPSFDFDLLKYSKGAHVSFIGEWTSLGTGMLSPHEIENAEEH